MPQEPLKICLASSEFTPLAKTGGLADVASALSVFLEGKGHDIRVLIPLYSSIDTSALEITQVDYLQNLAIKMGPHQLH
jgi:starch synthase